MRRRPGATAVTLLVLAVLLGCADEGTLPAADGSGGATLTVFAASSLTATFTELADAFEAGHEGTTVELSFGGSADLVAQVAQGAPADVVATADTATMDQLSSQRLVEDPVAFASNRLEIAVPPGNPADIATLQDLDRPGLALVVCAPAVPCGAATVRVAQAGGVTLSPVSEEQSVTDVLGKVASGEADAGLVYVTDVAAAGDGVEGIAFPESAAVSNTYPVGVVTDSPHPELAGDFVALLTGERGRAVLRAAGFGRP